MKDFLTLISVIIGLLALISCGNSPADGGDLPALYARLDSAMAEGDTYQRAREQHIDALKSAYRAATDESQRSALIDSLIDQYDAYNADSTLTYISLNLERPSVKSTPGEYTRMLIKRADVYAHAGLFPDALAIMASIPRDSITPALIEQYYSTYVALYQYLSEYNTNHETAREYQRQRTLYADSLSRVIAPGSFNHLTHVMAEMARNGQYDHAIKALTERLGDYELGTREYSILASTLAHIYNAAGHPEEYRRYLALSAISDTKGAVKENMSLRALATVMYEDGDVERANRYLKKSIADANFFSAIMRNAQSSKMLPVIDEAYMTVQSRLTSRLLTMVGVCCILLVILASTVVFILRQIKKIRRAKDEVTAANDELSHMSRQLKAANNELQDRNNELRDLNRIKEQYAVLFLESYSSAISALKQYQQKLRNLAQGGKEAALLRQLQSTEVSDEMLMTFYANFDEAILSIYPTFVGRFNALLQPGEQITLKPGELLSTELRLFALIRIGIDDNTKIAQFLRCSLSTVYTYRSKMKKRAVNPDTFDSDVRALS